MHVPYFLKQLVPQTLVNYCYHLPLSLLAVARYGYPARKLTVIGVTGTDGKTTTSTLIYEILHRAGKKAALISSVSARVGDKELDTGFHVTTPNAWELQKLLAKIVEKGFKYVILESTSHGLAQFRLIGCNFYLAALTNVTWEHIDYHGTWQKYLEAKSKLFNKVKFSILNKDDKSYQYLAAHAAGKITTYGLKNADFTPVNYPFKTKLPGVYNQYNCLAAISCCKELGISDSDIRSAVNNFSGIVGRMEIIKEKPYKIIVDFAHTPNGLSNALSAMQEMDHRHLIAVLGSAGLRDFRKRPLMGKIACQYADAVILTAEDPRTENVNKIISEIESGCSNKKKLYREPDRKKAINLAISLAREGDIIGIFGKGHEKSMCFGTKEYPWSDQKAVKEILAKKSLGK